MKHFILLLLLLVSASSFAMDGFFDGWGGAVLMEARRVSIRYDPKVNRDKEPYEDLNLHCIRDQIDANFDILLAKLIIND